MLLALRYCEDQGNPPMWNLVPLSGAIHTVSSSRLGSSLDRGVRLGGGSVRVGGVGEVDEEGVDGVGEVPDVV